MAQRPPPFTTLETFRELVDLSRQAICREIFQRNTERIKVKKERTAVHNLSRIIDATLTLANRKGFQATTLRDLGRQAGMSLGALYSYIGSKDELAALILRHGQLLTDRVMRHTLSGVTDPGERLATAVRTHVYLTEVLQPWFYFSYMESRNLGRAELESALQGELATESIIAEILRDGQRTGQFQGGDPDFDAASVKALLQDWYLKRWKYSRRQITADTYADHVIQLMERYLDAGMSARPNRSPIPEPRRTT